MAVLAKKNKGEWPPVHQTVWLHDRTRLQQLAAACPEHCRDLVCEVYYFNIRGSEYQVQRVPSSSASFTRRDAADLVEGHTGKRLLYERSLPPSLSRYILLGASIHQIIWPAFWDSHAKYWLAEDIELFLLPCGICGKVDWHARHSKWGGIVCSDECEHRQYWWLKHQMQKEKTPGEESEEE